MMLNKLNLLLIILFLTKLVNGQDSFRFPFNTLLILTDTFHKEAKSKDGFYFSKRNRIQIPQKLVEYIDKKKVKMKLVNIIYYTQKYNYDSLLKNNKSVPQGRIKKDFKGNSFIGGKQSLYILREIEVWNDKSKKWEAIVLNSYK